MNGLLGDAVSAQREGWVHLAVSKRLHWFSQQRHSLYRCLSLCGNYGVMEFPEEFVANPQPGDMCSACKRALAKRQKA